MGSMIPVPFILWLFFVPFNPDSSLDFTFAVLGSVGFISCLLTFIKLGSITKVLLEIIAFLLLLSPLVYKLDAYPEIMGHYFFVIPTLSFITFYLLHFISLRIKKYQ